MRYKGALKPSHSQTAQISLRRALRRDNLSTFICLFRIVVPVVVAVSFIFAFAYYFLPVFVFLWPHFLFIFDKDTRMINVEREGDIIIPLSRCDIF